MNKKQIEWLNTYCEKASEGKAFFLTNAGNIEFIYNKLKSMENNDPWELEEANEKMDKKFEKQEERANEDTYENTL